MLRSASTTVSSPQTEDSVDQHCTPEWPHSFPYVSYPTIRPQPHEQGDPHDARESDDRWSAAPLCDTAGHAYSPRDQVMHDNANPSYEPPRDAVPFRQCDHIMAYQWPQPYKINENKDAIRSDPAEIFPWSQREYWGNTRPIPPPLEFSLRPPAADDMSRPTPADVHLVSGTLDETQKAVAKVCVMSAQPATHTRPPKIDETEGAIPSNPSVVPSWRWSGQVHWGIRPTDRDSGPPPTLPPLEPTLHPPASDGKSSSLLFDAHPISGPAPPESPSGKRKRAMPNQAQNAAAKARIKSTQPATPLRPSNVSPPKPKASPSTWRDLVPSKDEVLVDRENQSRLVKMIKEEQEQAKAEAKCTFLFRLPISYIYESFLVGSD